MVNARLCETARLAFFLASPRNFDFLDCKTETSKCSERERETFRRLKFEPQIWLRAMRMSLYKSKPLYEKSLNSQETIIFLAMRRLVSDRPARTPRVVLAVASHDSLRVRFLI